MDDVPPSSAAVRPPPPSSSHRLATIPASHALLGLQSRGPRAISTGLDHLDTLLDTTHGGLGRGRITEVWGPPGSGKTSFALQAATSALNNGNAVVWVDATTSFPSPRLNHFLDANPSSHNPGPDKDSRLDNFHPYLAPTVAHLLALTLHPPQAFPPSNTALMVIDGLHSIFEISYPRHRANTFSSHKSEAAKWAAGRRYGIMGCLIAALKRLAALNDMAILVTTGCATRVRPGSGLGAVLVPGIGGPEWEEGVTNRLVMFRDFKLGTWSQRQEDPRSARYIGLQKVGGVAFSDEGQTGRLVPFVVEKDGLKSTDKGSAADAPVVTLAASSPTNHRKRAYAEIAGSDDEQGRDEYGWLNGDETAAEGLVDEAALVEDDADAVPTVVIDD